jgi:hypothetical protein
VHSFADKLYDPRSGGGVFYRWKPRDVRAICSARGIDRPAVHVSAVERIIQGPEGYAPGNMPPRLQLVATEETASLPFEAWQEAIARAHGGPDAPPLNRRHPAWVWIGLAGYMLFIAGALGAVLLWSAAGLGVLAGGLVGGYALTAWSAARAHCSYSDFWHRHRRTLRAALRRTAAPASPPTTVGV